MTFWASDHWRRYEAAYGSSISRVDELAAADWQTHVVDLTLSADAHLARVPKTMRQAIRRGDRELSLGVFAGPSPRFETFKHLHVAANRGVQPRSDETYEHQRQWMIAGHGLILLAWGCRDEYEAARPPVGGCFIIRYEGWAYYMSGPSLRPHVMPSVLWSAMGVCSALGDREFEVGWLKQDTEKERSISAFKQRFGGQNVPANYLAQREAALV